MDIANWCRVRINFWGGGSIDGLDNVKAWIDRLEARPACQRGVAVPHPTDFEQALVEFEKDGSGLKSIVTR